MDPELAAGLASGAPTMLGSGFGSVLNFIGQGQTNATNLQIANNANSASMANTLQQEGFQASMTADQEAFQTQSIQNQENYATQMSDTSYQRGVAGLEAAGLNPIMAASNPASTPQGTTSSGSAPSGSAAPVVAPQYKSPLGALGPLGDVGKDLLSMLQGVSALKNTSAQTALTQAQTLKAQVDTDMDSASAAQSRQATENMAADLPMKQATGKIGQWANSIADFLQTQAAPTAPQSGVRGFAPDDPNEWFDADKQMGTILGVGQ